MTKTYTLRAWDYPLKTVKADSVTAARYQYAEETGAPLGTVSLIFQGEAPLYKAHQIGKGWQVFFHETQEGFSRPVDGGKVYNNRQNAYKRAGQLNHPIKYAVKKYGMAECYFDGDTAVVREDDGEYTLTLQNAAMPPFYTKTGTLSEIEEEVRNSKFGGSTWTAIKPEEI